jgi:glutathione S-transferase
VDDLKALYCDEVLGALEDLTHYILRTYGLQEEELQLAREKLIDGWMSIYLRGLDQLLIRGGGEYFADNQLTIADLRAFVQTCALCSEILNYVPTDIVKRVTSGLFDHQECINADQRVCVVS